MWQKHAVLPAKSDSEVMFCLQSYQGLIIDSDLSNRVSSSDVYKVDVLLNNCKQNIRHCHSLLARQKCSTDCIDCSFCHDESPELKNRLSQSRLETS